MREREGMDARIVLVSAVRPHVSAPNLTMIDVYPAWPLFERAERIVTAAGFNVMRQTEPFRAKHRFVPFPRALDDQYTRASRARRPA
jgi:predicted glycosyltransferase